MCGRTLFLNTSTWFFLIDVKSRCTAVHHNVRISKPFPRDRGKTAFPRRFRRTKIAFLSWWGEKYITLTSFHKHLIDTFLWATCLWNLVFVYIFLDVTVPWRGSMDVYVFMCCELYLGMYATQDCECVNETLFAISKTNRHIHIFDKFRKNIIMACCHFLNSNWNPNSFKKPAWAKKLYHKKSDSLTVLKQQMKFIY